jgi:hypothetical protein
MSAVTQKAPRIPMRFAFGIDQFEWETYKVPKVIEYLRQVTVNDDSNNLELEWHFKSLQGIGAGLAFHWHADVFAETLCPTLVSLSAGYFTHLYNCVPHRVRCGCATKFRPLKAKSINETLYKSVRTDPTLRLTAFRRIVPFDTLTGRAVSITTSFTSKMEGSLFDPNGPSDHAHVGCVEQKQPCAGDPPPSATVRIIDPVL